MKSTKRVIIGASTMLTLLLVLLTRHLLDLGNQYSAFAYFQASFKKSLSYSPSNYPPAVGVEADDKIVVMAKVESEDTDWVAREVPSLVVTSSLSFRAATPYANVYPPCYLAGSAQSTPSTRPSFPPPTSHSPPL